MLGIMAWAMAGGHSVMRNLVAGLACALLAIGYAPASRTSGRARDHIVDLWAMVLLFVAPLIGPGAASLHGHSASPLGAPLLAAPLHAAPLLAAPLVGATIAIGWAAVRWLLLREHAEKTAATAGAAITAGTVAVMVFSCS
jgi:hypothetical protein